MNRFAFPLALAALLGAPLSATAASSVYTDAATGTCENLMPNPSQEDIDLGVAAFKCPGYKGYAYHFSENDVRQSTYFGYLSKEILDKAGETFEVFNHVGDRIEWRLDDRGVPRATIVRYTMENMNPKTFEADKAFHGQVLVVSRVGQPDDLTGCVVAYVDALANKDANTMARELADTLAPDFPCGRQKPVFHGKVGDKVSEPVYNFPALTEAN